MRHVISFFWIISLIGPHRFSSGFGTFAKASRYQVSKNIDPAVNFGLDDTMKTKSLFLSGCIALLSFAFVGTAAGGDTKIEQELRDLDAKWSAAAGAKDIDKTVSYYSEDAVVMPPNAPSAKTRETIRTAWKEMLTTPGAAISWKATKVEVAKSGDLACLSGTYQATTNDLSGKPVNDHGKYVEVWEKRADGTWKCDADIWNSDLPASAPATSPAPGAAEKK
jgi:ketosteroid isomerase-like protein